MSSGMSDGGFMSISSADGEVLKPKHVEIKAPILYITTLFQSTGASLIWPIATLYMHNVLHETMTMAGLVVMGLSIMMMIGSWVGVPSNQSPVPLPLQRRC